MTAPATPHRVPQAFRVRVEASAPARSGADDASRHAAGGEPLLALARALASSPCWRAMPEAVLVVRTAPPAGLAVLGRFSDAEVVHLEALPAALSFDLPRLRHVDYRQAERDCEALADRLRERFGRDALRAMHFAAIPRGGHVVLGMLAYALELSPRQLAAPSHPDTPLVVVDDCALTGLRFGELLETTGRRPVVFAHLYSHPELRAAIEREEPRVLGVVAARDLVDHAPELLGDGYGAWRERWRERTEGQGYWTGRPDPLSFAWAEPARTIWNPVTGRDEESWRLSSPDRCLRNRADQEAVSRVQLQPAGVGSLQPADDCYWGELHGAVLVAGSDGGPMARLTGIAADIWRRLVAHGEVEPTVRDLVALYDAPAGRLRGDVEAFVADARLRGLLAERAEHARASRPPVPQPAAR